MEVDWSPFEIRRTEKEITLYLRGIEGSRANVRAEDVHKIWKAIGRGWNIHIENAVIEGKIILSKTGIEPDDQGRFPVTSKLYISKSDIWGRTVFWRAKFENVVDFRGVKFKQEVYFQEAVFRETTVFTGSRFCMKVNFNKAIFREPVVFSRVRFFGEAMFQESKFWEKADFTRASFIKRAAFILTRFAEADFSEARFKDEAVFTDSKFEKTAIFDKARLKYPANFANVDLKKDTVLKGLWNNIIAPPIAWFVAKARRMQPEERQQLKERLETTVTDVYSINTGTVMDASTNPYLKRYIDDEQWVNSWRYSGKLQRGLFYVWEAMCHCGRSFGSWAGWSAFFILLFSVIFTPAPHWWPEWWWGFWRDHGVTFQQTAPAYSGEPVNLWSCLYFSIVNFTTLGFGDIVAANWQARFWVAFEVVLGYVMLGGLVSIFANKLARRS